ncbi:MAG: TerB family tellurite resistance protein, partial [Myxococcota bacterium]|nr:TerB family tellurite resistance protein [Myxococcota bacterium]
SERGVREARSWEREVAAWVRWLIARGFVIEQRSLAGELCVRPREGGERVVPVFAETWGLVEEAMRSLAAALGTSAEEVETVRVGWGEELARRGAMRAEDWEQIVRLLSEGGAAWELVRYGEEGGARWNEVAGRIEEVAHAIVARRLDEIAESLERYEADERLRAAYPTASGFLKELFAVAGAVEDRERRQLHAYFVVCVALALEDGAVTDEERRRIEGGIQRVQIGRFLSEYERKGILVEVLDEASRGGADDRQVEGQQGDSLSAAVRGALDALRPSLEGPMGSAFIGVLAHVAAADRVIGAEERAFIARVGAYLGVDAGEVESILQVTEGSERVEVDPTDRMWFCGPCVTLWPADATFCGYCGARLRGREEARSAVV